MMWHMAGDEIGEVAVSRMVSVVVEYMKVLGESWVVEG